MQIKIITNNTIPKIIPIIINVYSVFPNYNNLKYLFKHL